MRKTILAATMAALTVPTMAATTVPAMAKQRHYYTTDNGIRYWRGDDGRYRCKKPNGTTGLLIGGVAGALLGRTIDGGRDKTVGTVAGAAVGALVGREIDRNNSKPRCR
ncbi:hypothetical protein B2G71_05495 [Novosphingobium sp. PC22D]|uniref:glycine zipper 2TM domain-containing protein n=1 Tax=Novosphingobium sp. PC22D TaxID=1962403 RepID=UPI000BF0C981|nr:glycine zipper 2TM domain-containing protein [Novosphingobium sp. PC22D]PEQ13769.1 hypothetical protein B2G71_05495 [Novosphingobium sp. PC22D]